jgi:hypothetical protein
MIDKTRPNPNRNGDLEDNQLEFQVPDESDIEYLFSTIRFQPSARFYNQRRSKPWDQKNRKFYFSLLHPKGLLTALAFLAVIFLIFMSPSLEAVANRISRYFTPASSDQFIAQMPLFDLVDPGTRVFNTIQGAAEVVGFNIRSPYPIPNGYKFMGAEYKPDREVVILNYNSQDGNILRISQRRKGIEYQRISINAQIENVKINGEDGEYVEGGWKATSTHFGEPTSILTITIQAHWDPDVNIHFLRWQENDILYEIIFSGVDSNSDEYLDKFDLISIAENLH